MVWRQLWLGFFVDLFLRNGTCFVDFPACPATTLRSPPPSKKTKRMKHVLWRGKNAHFLFCLMLLAPGPCKGHSALYLGLTSFYCARLCDSSCIFMAFSLASHFLLVVQKSYVYTFLSFRFTSPTARTPRGGKKKVGERLLFQSFLRFFLSMAFFRISRVCRSFFCGNWPSSKSHPRVTSSCGLASTHVVLRQP